MIAELTAILVRWSGTANVMDASVGHLLAQRLVCCSHCKAGWEEATVEQGHKVVRAAQDVVIREYAESLTTPLGAAELVVALKARLAGPR